ncbi:hypothetical protein [Brevibacillus laterosporus]|uniref:hypothetical protein n=1 Tax=Brevibacillus laterosporus TaxID=1465 RepID=UPI002E1E0D27|nr:hypothetical protein [Brevibacillus laterosporus]MED1667265.1 hypothetical protein [Brevibacillus laterosporus]MED1719667.1 hypothetical protein [Brevibacillus laterosporus]
MELYSVWRKKGSSGVGEKCLMREDGKYIGVTAGNVYDQESHYHSERLIGKIISVDRENKTGMHHLCREWGNEENKISFKEKFIGCLVTVEAAHFANSVRIYRCLELGEYFSEFEIEIS